MLVLLFDLSDGLLLGDGVFWSERVWKALDFLLLSDSQFHFPMLVEVLVLFDLLGQYPSGLCHVVETMVVRELFGQQMSDLVDFTRHLEEFFFDF